MVRRERCPGCRAESFDRLVVCSYSDAPIAAVTAETVKVLPEFRTETYELRRCRVCALAWQVVAPDDDLAIRLYGQASAFEAVAEAHQALDFYVSAAREIAMIVSAFDAAPHRLRFLDFGMGRGEWARLAAAFGVKSFGVELTAAAREHAQAFGVVALAPEELAGHEFDLVHTEQVFEHLADPLGTLERLRGVLAPAGLVKISVPDAVDLDRRLALADWEAPKGSARSLECVAPIHHVNAFQRRSILAMAAAAGFEEAKLPARAYYRLGEVAPGRPLLKALARPLYRNVLGRGTYVFLRASRNGTETKV